MKIIKLIRTTVAEQLPVAGPHPASNEPLQTTLYTCTACETTYIASEMETCSRCQTHLEEIPSESELGFTSVES